MTGIIGAARKVVPVLLVAWLVVAVPPATGAVLAGSETFNPNQPGPTFGSPTPLPMITISVTYDDQAGTITVSETGGDPSYPTGFAWFDSIDLTGTNAPTVDIKGYWNYPISPTLSDSAVNGALSAGQFSKSSDGSTLTALWSDPALANQPLRFVNIIQSDQPDNTCSCDVEPGGSFYFPGHEPSVQVQNAGTQTTQVGTPLGLGACGDGLGPCCPDSAPFYSGPCPGLQLSATEINVANGAFGDDPSSSDGTQPVSSFNVMGLPPGLTNQGAVITGKPTVPGTYLVSVTATAGYNLNKDTASGSTSFTWVITPPPPPPPRALPTLLNPWKGSFSVRPAIIGLSGDGTSFLGGANGHGKQTRKNWPRWAGHIVWTRWTTSQAQGFGVNWLDNCRPDCASGKYYAHPAKLRAYAPRNGHFTRLWTRIKYHGRWRTHTSKLVYSHGSWYWG